MKDNKMETSALKYFAMKNAESLVADDEIRRINMTDVFRKEIKNMIDFRELINIQILGTVVSGKSTVAIELCREICDLLKIKIDLKNITADQLEFLRKVMDTEVNNTCLVIDEWNELSTTGLNATTEEAFFKYFSDVQAQRFIHRISCAPMNVTDKNANIILEVLDKNVKKKITRCLLYYKVLKNNYMYTQLIGYIDVNVSKVLGEDYYKRYRKRKFKKMELVIKEGVKDIRDLEYAEIILFVSDKLKRLAEIGGVNNEIVANYIEKVRRDNRKFLSILTTEDLIRKVNGVLALYKQIQKVDNEVMKIKRKGKKITGLDKERMEILQEAKVDMQEVLEAVLKNYKTLKKLNSLYKTI